MPAKQSIEKIYIACSKKDFYFAKLCIASIRYWEIHIPIFLIVDNAWGIIDTSYLEKYWNVTKFESPYHTFKESYGKLEPLFETGRRRILTMDADIVLLGNIVDALNQIDADFICQQLQLEKTDKELNTWWFNVKKLEQWDKSYTYPGYVFYAGQLVTYSDLIKREDFSKVLSFGNPPVLKQPDIFLNNADQGLLNYIIHQKVATSKLTILHYEFFIGRYDTEQIKSLQLKDVIQKKGIPRMLHYYGPKTGLLANLPAKSILVLFEKYYYRHYSFPLLHLLKDRLARTLKNPFLFAVEKGKEIFKQFA